MKKISSTSVFHPSSLILRCYGGQVITVRRTLILSIFAAFFLLAGCAPDAFPASDYRPPVSTRVSAAPTAIATPLPVSTPEDVPDAVKGLESALKANDPAQLAPFMLNEVWIAQQGNEAAGESMERDASVTWLKAHWGKVTVASSDYARDSALLTLSTSGWAKRAPLTQGIIILNLHRYDSSGSMDDVQGQWKIDTILYQ